MAAIKVDVAPVEPEQLGASEPGRQEREQDEAVPLCEAASGAPRPAGGVEHPAELVDREPIALLSRASWRVEFGYGGADALALRHPPQEPSRRMKRRW